MDSHLKETVRDRIRSLLTTYPFNTAIVTSRIIGYDAPFRFDAKAFTHCRLTRLRADEIERFVRDWYATRIEDEVERNEHIDDLIRVLSDPDYESLQELARNPLLLSIIALVHRIDAVLPDQRVILYQRCTETLLETWHTWKFRAQIGSRRGRDVRRNRERIETIAHWMHTQTDGTADGQGAIMPYQALHQHLTEHIGTVERVRNREVAIDRAADFLIRDIAYGDESRIDDLQAMINSDDPAYRELFERCYWVDRNAD